MHRGIIAPELQASEDVIDEIEIIEPGVVLATAVHHHAGPEIANEGVEDVEPGIATRRRRVEPDALRITQTVRRNLGILNRCVVNISRVKAG